MGDLNQSELREALRYKLDNRNDLTETQLNRWLKWSYHHVSRPNVVRHNELRSSDAITLVTDQVSYSLTNVYWIAHIVFVCGTDSTDYTVRRKRLEYGSMRVFEDRLWTQSEPVEYAREGGSTIYIDQRPPSSINGFQLLVRGWRQPEALTDTTTTVLATDFDDVILEGAAWRGWRALNRPDNSMISKTEFLDLLEDLTDQSRIEGEDWGHSVEIDNDRYMEFT